MRFQHSMGLGRGLLLVAAYSVVIVASLLAALILRFDFAVPEEFWRRFWVSLAWILPLKLALLAAFGQFRSLLTFFSLPDAKKIGSAMGAAALIEMLVWFVLRGHDMIPRGVIVSDLVISFLGIAGLRTSLRIYRERLIGSIHHSPGAKRRAAVVGTGPSAAMLLRDIQTRPGLGIEVACVIDDDPRKIGGTLHGLPVVGPMTRLPEIAKSVGLQKIIIALPDARPAEIKNLVTTVNALGLEHDILPSVAQLLNRRVTVTHLRRVEAEDLLGREQVALDEKGITDLINGASVMITGAGGSIGSELARQVLASAPSKLVLVDRSEAALFSICHELAGGQRDGRLVARAHDVCDEAQMEFLFAEHRPEIVFHAAAHKHVPLMEEQPAEALRNNVTGTAVVACLALRHAARKFVLISTDKAVKPASIMGATKRMAEMVISELQTSKDSMTAFSAVRFGNVLGSSGSVVPIFRRQISEGGPVTLTHPEVTRYFMSITEAVGLILQSALQSRGGELFVLDMGEPVKIADLARQMIELSGLTPGEDISIVVTGLRAGEKLYEEPVHTVRELEATAHPKVKLLRREQTGGASLLAELRGLRCDLANSDEFVREWLAARIADYSGKAPVDCFVARASLPLPDDIRRPEFS